MLDLSTIQRKYVSFIVQCVAQMCSEYAFIFGNTYYCANGHALYQKWVCQQQMFTLNFLSVASKVICECPNEYNSLTDISQLESNLKSFNIRRKET